jgi:hypothetical protein
VLQPLKNVKKMTEEMDICSAEKETDGYTINEQ